MREAFLEIMAFEMRSEDMHELEEQRGWGKGHPRESKSKDMDPGMA